MKQKISGNYYAVPYCSLHPAFLVRCEMVRALLFLSTYPGFIFVADSVAIRCNWLKLPTSIKGTMTAPEKLQLSHNMVFVSLLNRSWFFALQEIEPSLSLAVFLHSDARHCSCSTLVIRAVSRWWYKGIILSLAHYLQSKQWFSDISANNLAEEAVSSHFVLWRAWRFCRAACVISVHSISRRWDIRLAGASFCWCPFIIKSL